MILHKNTLLSEDLFEKHFICDLSKCKGACCIEGDFGAPLADDEVKIIENNLEHIKPYLEAKSIAALEKHGVWEKDKDGDVVTTCLPTGECNFALRGKDGVLACGIENACKDGALDFRKPVSCHLYPIRISKVGEYDALNYNRWDICSAACKLGAKHQVSIFDFLKDALIRTYGQEWYDEVAQIQEEYLNSLK